MLYARLTQDGTIAEPRGKPLPQFALPSAVNWMRALRILGADAGLDFGEARRFYAAAGVAPRPMTPQEVNTALEQLFLSLHHLSALQALAATGQDTEFARVGVVTWHDGLWNAAAAMLAAQAGRFHEAHAALHRDWDAEIAQRGLAMTPFAWRLSSLLGPTIAAETQALRGAGSGDLQTTPASQADAIGAASQYLSGSGKWYAERAEDWLRDTRAFKALGVADFRTKAARAMRDELLASRGIGFLHLAYRYRGKANTREAIFLAYGPQAKSMLAGYLADLQAVLGAFVAMAGAFVAARVAPDLWQAFLADADQRRAFALSPLSVWS